MEQMAMNDNCEHRSLLSEGLFEVKFLEILSLFNTIQT